MRKTGARQFGGAPPWRGCSLITQYNNSGFLPEKQPDSETFSDSVMFAKILI